jgi:hypothetical protein
MPAHDRRLRVGGCRFRFVIRWQWSMPPILVAARATSAGVIPCRATKACLLNHFNLQRMRPTNFAATTRLHPYKPTRI